MRAWTSNANRWRWPDLGVIGWLDLVLALPLLALLNALALRTYAEYVMQARFVEVLVVVGNARYDLVERFALSGEPIDMPAGAGDAARLRDATDLLRRQGGAGLDDAPQPPSKPQERPEVGTAELLRSRLSQNATPQVRSEESRSSRYVSQLRTEGSVVMASGSIEGRGDDYDFALVPLVLEGRVPQVIAWQCDPRAMPAGWTGPTARLERPPPAAWLPRLCRTGRAAP